MPIERESISAGDRVLVTGGTGFIGRATSRALADLGADVHITSRRAGAGPRRHQVDLADRAAVAALLERLRPDLIVDLAADVAGDQSLERLDGVYWGTLRPSVHVLAAAVAVGCTRRILHAGTLVQKARPGQPAPSAYGAAKEAVLAFAQTCHLLYELPVVTVQPAYVYGPGQDDRSKLVPHVVTNLLAGRDAALGAGSRLTDWLYIDDCVDGILAALQVRGVEGSAFELGTGTGVAVREAAEMVEAMVGGPGRLRFGAEGDRAHESPRLADPEPARTVLGWQAATSLEEGLRRTVEHWRRTSAEWGAA